MDCTLQAWRGFREFFVNRATRFLVCFPIRLLALFAAVVSILAAAFLGLKEWTLVESKRYK
jgi:hypothetical protein